jgi:hypothetical protein
VATTQDKAATGRRSSKAASLLSLLLGGALIAFSAPRAAVETAVAIAAPAIRAVEVLGLSAPSSAVRSSLAWTLTDLTAGQDVSVQALTYAGRLRIVASGNSPKPDALLAEAAADFARALAASPTDSWNWHRYAHATYASGLYLEAARAWRMSVVTGAFDPDLMFIRVQSGLALWPYMDRPAREALGRQLLIHWTWGPDGLAEIIARFGAGAQAAQAMSPWPDASLDLQQRISRIPTGA